MASISAEIVVVSLLIIIPLAYNDHLPAFRWSSSVTVAPPPLRQVDTPPPTAQSSSPSTGPAVFHPIFNLSSLPKSGESHPVAAGVEMAEPPGIIGGFEGGSSPLTGLIGRPTVVKPPPTPAPTVTATKKTITVGGDVQSAKLINRVMPVYPDLARRARISGVVHLIGFIAKDGTIRNLQVVSGHPMLTQAALAAVQQWIYRPTLLNGEPVEVIAPIDVNFTLNER